MKVNHSSIPPNVKSSGKLEFREVMINNKESCSFISNTNLGIPL